MKFTEALEHLAAGRRARLPWMGVAPGQVGHHSIARDGDDFRFENGTTYELDAEDVMATDWELAEFKPPHLHGHFVLNEGETLAERCPTGECTWERFKLGGFFAIDRSPTKIAANSQFSMSPGFFAAPMNEAVKELRAASGFRPSATSLRWLGLRRLPSMPPSPSRRASRSPALKWSRHERPEHPANRRGRRHGPIRLAFGAAILQEIETQAFNRGWGDIAVEMPISVLQALTFGVLAPQLSRVSVNGKWGLRWRAATRDVDLVPVKGKPLIAVRCNGALLATADYNGCDKKAPVPESDCGGTERSMA